MNVSREKLERVLSNSIERGRKLFVVECEYSRRTQTSFLGNGLIRLANIKPGGGSALLKERKGLDHDIKCVNFFKLRHTIYMYLFVCTNKQLQILYDLTKILVTNSKAQKPFPWYCCLVMVISPHPVN